MYLMITSRCNMTCKHCGMGCKKKGEDMTLETFRNAISYEDESITLGGGEPTIHPFFWQMLGESMARVSNVFIVTNGSQTETAIALARLAKKGLLGVDLSLDEFHDPIDPKVIEAFTKDKSSSYSSDNTDFRQIRDTSDHLIKAGRCKDGEKGCICEDLIVRPNGDVMACGCKKAEKFGNVNTSFEMPDWWDGMCNITRDKKES